MSRPIRAFSIILKIGLALLLLPGVRFHAILLCHGVEVGEHCGVHFESFHIVGVCPVLSGDLLAVAVNVSDGVAVDDSLGHYVAVIFGEGRRVERHEHIGGDAAAPVDGSAELQCIDF